MAKALGPGNNKELLVPTCVTLSIGFDVGEVEPVPTGRRSSIRKSELGGLTCVDETAKKTRGVPYFLVVLIVRWIVRIVGNTERETC
jgi:hypothetical protein